GAAGTGGAAPPPQCAGPVRQLSLVDLHRHGGGLPRRRPERGVQTPALAGAGRAAAVDRHLPAPAAAVRLLCQTARGPAAPDPRAGTGPGPSARTPGRAAAALRRPRPAVVRPGGPVRGGGPEQALLPFHAAGGPGLQLWAVGTAVPCRAGLPGPSATVA